MSGLSTLTRTAWWPTSRRGCAPPTLIPTPLSSGAWSRKREPQCSRLPPNGETPFPCCRKFGVVAWRCSRTRVADSNKQTFNKVHFLPSCLVPPLPIPFPLPAKDHAPTPLPAEARHGGPAASVQLPPTLGASSSGFRGPSPHPRGCPPLLSPMDITIVDTSLYTITHYTPHTRCRDAPRIAPPSSHLPSDAGTSLTPLNSGRGAHASPMEKGVS